MGRPMKKRGECGTATTYISRRPALKKLQLSLKDFRRLCILKGIYPVEPKHKQKATKNNSTNKTYYRVKDINFLSHEPLIQKFREFKVFIRRLKRSIGKRDEEASDRLRQNQPIYTVDHIVKERYPTLIDALRDLDDALSMCFLFSTFPKSKNVKVELIELCRRLTVEFMYYVIESRSLRKVFYSIKGVYYQVEIMGQVVTWIVPHVFGYAQPTDVDFRIMVTFTDFYSTLLGFVNCHLFHSVNLIYPPKLAAQAIPGMDLLKGEDDPIEMAASLNTKLKAALDRNIDIDDVEIDEFPESEDAKDLQIIKQEQNLIKLQQTLFKECKIFINREVPRESLVFVIRTLGGEVSYDKTLFVGSTFDETDETITHQIVDRPMKSSQMIKKRYYVQPQWVYDSVNACILLPVEDYAIGKTLPPHFSPFVEEKYDPVEVREQSDLGEDEFLSFEKAIAGGDSDSGMEDENQASVSLPVNSPKKANLKKLKVTPGKVRKVIDDGGAADMREEKRLAVMMIPKSKKHLYDKIVFGQKRKLREAKNLKEKREAIAKNKKLKIEEGRN